ncbi:hypothetical protein P3H15_27355 [Rhodococcus sp. T2V]|uniref:hypothetical protein n=1 Tax=Rhodococcus sp. T2V TaxID=3034164 RepID=UPI0023E1F3A1|nr:hypothetical protein [Rhodococcus sp. T2V]MDF3308740.1 hypothetical protein [Rhodococcus sp. T2V]
MITEPNDLPEPIEEDGQLLWLPKMSTVIAGVNDGQVLIDDTVRGEYPADRVREFGLALVAAASAALEGGER